MSGGHAEDQVPPSNVTPINPADRAVDLPGNAPPASPKDAQAEEEAPPVPTPTPSKSEESAEVISELHKDLRKQVKEARELLFYASDEGITIETSIIETIVSASEKEDLSNQEVVAVITSIAALSKELRVRANRSIRPFLYCVVALGIFLIVISTFSFLAGSYSKALTDEITRANQFALDLNSGSVTQLADPEMRKIPITDAKMLPTLQQFAASIRTINETSNLLGWLVLTRGLSDEDLMVEDVSAAPTPPGAAGVAAPRPRPPLELRIPATYGQIKDKTEQFQTVRAHARGLQDRVTGFYGALTNAILPSLYAILGVCAFLLKTFSDQVRAHTFRLSADAEGARFIIAAIGGGVVGLFGNFTSGSGDSLSLLAVAFLIGYATDVFFTFLDGLEQAFMKSKSSAQEQKRDGAA
jgi:hypothetical protein